MVPQLVRLTAAAPVALAHAVAGLGQFLTLNSRLLPLVFAADTSLRVKL
jgi:hypothetical protein